MGANRFPKKKNPSLIPIIPHTCQNQKSLVDNHSKYVIFNYISFTVVTRQMSFYRSNKSAASGKGHHNRMRCRCFMEDNYLARMKETNEIQLGSFEITRA